MKSLLQVGFGSVADSMKAKGALTPPVRNALASFNQ
jgi:hypothetical protein